MNEKMQNDRGLRQNPRVVARITWEQDGQKRDQAIGNRKITIGRADENEIAVKDTKASRFHCFLKSEEDSGMEPCYQR